MHETQQHWNVRRGSSRYSIDFVVAGDADILVAPDLKAGYMMAKQLICLAGADATGMVLGAREWRGSN